MEKLDVITCIVQRGESDKVTRAAIEAGAQGATTFYARGVGVRQKLGMLGALIQPEKEVILIVTKSQQTDAVFDAAVRAGRLDRPGMGFAYVQKVERAVGFLEDMK